MKTDFEKVQKENISLSEQIKRFNDPVVVRFERDALVETHKKRIKELEAYVKNLEHQNSELQTQMQSMADCTSQQTHLRINDTTLNNRETDY